MNFRRALLIVALAIVAYLFALLAPIVPVQVFISCSGGFDCGLILSHDRPVHGGFVVDYVYSITRQLTGFGAYYNIDEGYVLPSGLPWLHNTFLTGFGVFLFIILPLSLVMVVSLVVALLISRKVDYSTEDLENSSVRLPRFLQSLRKSSFPRFVLLLALLA